MTVQRRRAEHILATAQRAEHQARAELSTANQATNQVGDEISTIHRSGRRLGELKLDPRAQASLNQVGARKLTALSQTRSQLRAEANEKHQAWDRSRMRVQSLEKLVERLRQTEQTTIRRHEATELLDAITAQVSSKPTHESRR